VHRLLAPSSSKALARIFIEAHRQKSACLDDYGEKFADFLSDFEPAASLAYLPEVIRLEWAVNRVLHAPTRSRAIPVALRAREAEESTSELVPHPSVSLLRVDHSADLIWRAALEEDDDALSAIDPGAGPARLLVQRLAYRPSRSPHERIRVAESPPHFSLAGRSRRLDERGYRGVGAACRHSRRPFIDFSSLKNIRRAATGDLMTTLTPRSPSDPH